MEPSLQKAMMMNDGIMLRNTIIVIIYGVQQGNLYHAHKLSVLICKFFVAFEY
jgi:hypothetical protein